MRWHDLRGTCATLLLMQGISPKAIAKNLGHSTEIVTVDNYIDKSKLSVIKLDKLDSFIDSVVPKTNCEEEDKDFSRVIIDVSEFFRSNIKKKRNKCSFLDRQNQSFVV